MLNYVGPGNTMPLSGLASNVNSGALYSVGGSGAAAGKNFWGVVVDDIIGTGSALTTVDGRPILDEDLTGLSIQGVNVGDGKGDMKVEGVFELVVASGVAQSASNFRKGSAVYASGVNTVAGPSLRFPGAFTATGYGMVAVPAAFTTTGAPECMSLVGHVWKEAYLDLRSASPFKGSWVCEVKLLGRPTDGLS